jgi:hypothetical protein
MAAGLGFKFVGALLAAVVATAAVSQASGCVQAFGATALRMPAKPSSAFDAAWRMKD